MAPKAYIFSQKPLTGRSAPTLDLVPCNAEAVVTSHRSPIGCRTTNDCKVSCCWFVRTALLRPVEIIVDCCDIG